MKRQGPQHHRVDHAEHRAVGADAEGAGYNHHGAKQRLVEQDAKRMSKIIHNCLLAAECDDGIYPGSTPGRNETGDQSNTQQRENRADRSSGIQHPNIVKH
jgi:hypothetical protein